MNTNLGHKEPAQLTPKASCRPALSCVRGWSGRTPAIGYDFDMGAIA